MIRALPVALLILGCGSDWNPDAPEVPALGPLEASITIQSADGPVTVKGPVAATDAERAKGLMYRKERLADDEAMLFVMDEDKSHSFWMKNTYIPLDMLFVDVHGNIVCVIEEAQPLTTTSRRCEKPSRYVIEVDGGWSRRHRVFAGQQADIQIF